MNMDQLLHSLRVPERFHVHAKQLTKFAITGFSNLLIDIALLALFVEVFLLPLAIAAPLDSLIVLTNVFLMNKHWTFKNGHGQYASQGFKFALVYGSSFILVNAITLLLAEIFLLWYIASRLIAIACCALWNYTWMHLKVFK